MMKAHRILSASTALLLMAGCNNESKYEVFRDKPIAVEIAVVGENGADAAHHYIGEILAQSEIPLNFLLGGEITAIKVKNGAHVTKGQVIATVDSRQQRSMLESSQAMLHQAEDGYARLEKVHAKGGVSEVKWIEMQTNLAKAKSMKETVQKNYDDCTLRAQADGVVNLDDVHVGMRLVPGQRIGTLLTMNGMRAAFTVPETDVANIRIGEEIAVEVPAIKRTVKARVAEKNLVSTHLAHNYTLRATINAGDAKDLLQGMVCKISVASDATGGLVVPARSIQVRTDGVNVWVVKNGRAERRTVTLGEYTADGVMIASGLQAGDTVVAVGNQKMFNGALLKF